MSAVQSLIEGGYIVFSWPTIGWLVAGLLLGIVLGAIPGIGPGIGIALALPLTLPLDGIAAIIFLTAIYFGGMYGGSISAILINTPGTPAAAATTFDGNPLAKKGRSLDVLATSATSSAIGGIIASTLLILISPLILTVVLAFTSPAYFLTAIVGLSLITVATQGSIIKGLIAGAFGLLISTIGVAPMAPTSRYNFGIIELFDGLHFVAVLVGLFAISEMFILAGKTGGISEQIQTEGSATSGIKETFRYPINLVKSSVLGVIIGAIPGAGAAVANFVAYAESMRSSDDPDSYGKGNIRGVVAAESANNGTVGGSLVPTLAFGIPGSGSTALLLGGLLLHGLQPGPRLFGDQLNLTYALFISLFVSSILIFIIGVRFVIYTRHILTIDTSYIIASVVVLAVLGVLSFRNNWIDPITMVAFGILGYYMRKHDYSLIAIVLGIVLGPIAESNLHRSLQLSGGSWDIFIEDPLSILMIGVTIFILLTPLIKRIFNKNS